MCIKDNHFSFRYSQFTPNFLKFKSFQILLSIKSLTKVGLEVICSLSCHAKLSQIQPLDRAKINVRVSNTIVIIQINGLITLFIYSLSSFNRQKKITRCNYMY